MSLQIYIINDENGKIISCGKVNQERDQKLINAGDTSTCFGFIQKKIQSTPGLRVLYLPLSAGMPDIKSKKINNDNSEIIDKNESDFKKEEIQNKEAEIIRLEKITSVQEKLIKARSELAILQAV